MMRTQKILVISLCIRLLETIVFAENSTRADLYYNILYYLKRLLRECKRDQTNDETECAKRTFWQNFRVGGLPIYLRDAWVETLRYFSK